MDFRDSISEARTNVAKKKGWKDRILIKDLISYRLKSNKRSKADFTVGNIYFTIIRKARPSFFRVLHTKIRLN